MYKNNEALPIPEFWKYVDELAGRDLNLAYPTQVIKSLKSLYFLHGEAWFKELSELTLNVKNSQGEVKEMTMTPNARKAIRDYFINRPINLVGKCPSSKEWEDILVDTDKYYSMMVYLKRELPTINNCIHIGEYKYAALLVASLIESYNTEIIKLINEYFRTHTRYSTEDKEKFQNFSRNRFFHVIANRSFMVSNEPYVAIIFFEVSENNNKPEIEFDTEVIYENYNVNVIPSKERIKPQGSFLQDCKAIARKKREMFFGNLEILEFHDLMKYGSYNDRILSIEVMKEIFTIFGHKSWNHQFFLTLSLYCDRYLKIDDFDNDVKSGALVDPNKVQDFDLFIKVIKYLDSIYEELVIRDNK